MPISDSSSGVCNKVCWTSNQYWDLARELIVSDEPGTSMCVLVCLYGVVPAAAHLRCLTLLIPLFFSCRSLVILLWSPITRLPTEHRLVDHKPPWRTGSSSSDPAASSLLMLIACASATRVALRSFVAGPTASCPRLVQPASSTRPAATLLHPATPIVNRASSVCLSAAVSKWTRSASVV